MLNTVYRLVAPRRFEVAFNDIDLQKGQVVVRPTYLSICHADQRYYQGTRPIEVMKQKLPMALIHEGLGEVVYDATGTFQSGDSVIMIPNIPKEKDAVIAENYLRSSKFRASSYDGFMQEHVALEPDRVIPLDSSVDKVVAAFTELVSVSVHALCRFDSIAHQRRNVIGVWGDGNLAYITAVFFRAMFPAVSLYVFGVHQEKLSQFSFADGTFLVTDIPPDLSVDHAFECVGGEASQRAINQIIDHICPEGTISLLGVSEYPVPINTRMVLEKGLRIFGSSRSGRDDFLKTVSLYRSHPEIVGYLSNIVGAQIEIRTIADMNRAFETDIHKSIGKTIMIWNK
ncbi:MAG TPA: ribitol-5-phosphate dehydrogenase [Lachnospiraceae bacterium]|nr:ribitol-5-phosphate dehydrogenase [Lachnospiraceae bacterium]HBI61099.1 ribitol-5-phosphate dehydrogenase [Lachnospiraceae bacterium]